MIEERATVSMDLLGDRLLLLVAGLPFLERLLIPLFLFFRTGETGMVFEANTFVYASSDSSRGASGNACIFVIPTSTTLASVYPPSSLDYEVTTIIIAAPGSV